MDSSGAMRRAEIQDSVVFHPVGLHQEPAPARSAALITSGMSGMSGGFSSRGQSSFGADTARKYSNLGLSGRRRTRNVANDLENLRRVIAIHDNILYFSKVSMIYLQRNRGNTPNRENSECSHLRVHKLPAAEDLGNPFDERLYLL
jgi:hypothetical protein